MEQATAEDPLLQAEPAQTEPTRIRRRRFLQPEDADVLALRILEAIRDARYERADWIEKRLARYAKLRGWLDEGRGPWDNSSNQHIPLIMTNCLRFEAGLFNAVLGTRPVVFGKPTRLEHQQIAERNDSLLDHQMFVDNEGDRNLERFITQFVQDGTVFSYQPRVVERHSIHDVKVVPRPAGDLASEMPNLLTDLAKDHGVVFESLVMEDEDGYTWCGYFLDAEKDEREVEIEVYDKPGEGDYGVDKLEIVFTWDATIYDGPTMQVQDLEDVIAPMRAENLQPVTGQNPKGAPWVALKFQVSLDAVKRRVKDKTYDLLSPEDLEQLGEHAVGRAERELDHDEDSIKEAKDAKTGLSPMPTQTDERVWLTGYEWYGAWDLNGDGLDEECIVVVLEGIDKVARIRYLTEQYPGLPPHRPVAEARFIPVPGQLYGMGLPELIEGMSDFIHELVNDNVNAGRLASIPFFGYNPTGGLKDMELRLEPGLGVKLQNPQQDLAFYQIPGGDQAWAFNMIGWANQVVERETQIGALQFGQVPQGKASALRSTGNMMAVLQQSAAMPEQILRRLFMGIRDVYAQFHLLNTRFLPSRKRYLVTGKPLSQDDAYGMIDDRNDINIPLTFDFQATLLNSNKGMVQQSLQQMLGVLVSPLMMQTGMVTPEEIYNLGSDFIKSAQLDPARYLRRPAGVTDEVKITAEEAILDMTKGLVPQSTAFLEGAQAALAKLQQFMQSDEFGFLNAKGVEIFKGYIRAVVAKAQEEMQQQMLMQAAAQFQQSVGGPKDQGGAPTQPGSAPQQQMEAPAQEEVAGADAQRSR